MKRKSITLILFVGALVLTALTYAMVGNVFRTSGAYAFLFSRGLYQPISLTFFFFGLLLVGHRWLLFREERTIVEIEIPDGTITPANAKEFSIALEAKHGSSILGRRLAALLQGSARHEEIGPLEERLKARDRDELDQSAALVGWVRSLPPLVGLLIDAPAPVTGQPGGTGTAFDWTKLGAALGIDARQILLPHIEPSQERQRDHAPRLVLDEKREDNKNMSINIRRTGRPGSRIVVDAGTLNVRTIARRRRVVQRERQPFGSTHQRLDHRDQQRRGDLVGLLADRRNRRVTRSELRAQAGRADPAGDRPATAREHRAEEQKDQPRSGPPVECGSESRKPLAGSGVDR